MFPATTPSHTASPFRRLPHLASLALLGLAAVTAAGRQTSVARAGLAASDALSGEVPSAGEALFRQRCALCHTTGEQAAQGPGLGRVLGRKAASARGFAYSPALKGSGLTWDRATLERFLSAPSALVAGTLMPVALPDPGERREIVDYLASLDLSSPGTASSSLHEGGTAAPRAIPSAGDYRNDEPGVRRRVRLADLPAPFATLSARNGPSIVAPPPDARPRVPAGFSVDLFASGLSAPRLIRVAPCGDAFVAESAIGQIRVLRARDGARATEETRVFAAGLDRPFGIAFFPPGPEPRWMYVADTNAVVRFPYARGDLRARGPAQTIVARLSEVGGGHWTRDIAFSNDGSRMLVSVGSGSNVAEDMRVRFASDIAAWEESRAVGAPWDDEQDRADVLEFDPEGREERTFATGIRNCVGLSVHPATGDVWCSTNERDGLGDDLVPDYITRVRPRAFYGWPWYYLGDHEDPRHEGERPDLADKVARPDVLLQAHSAPLQTTFYEGAMFPAAYRGGVFACLHGSWNRARRTGPKVVFLPLDRGGVPTGEYEDFLTGFVVDDASVWGRPVGVAVAHDGALLVSEDGNGTIWRVAYRHASP